MAAMDKAGLSEYCEASEEVHALTFSDMRLTLPMPLRGCTHSPAPRLSWPAGFCRLGSYCLVVVDRVHPAKMSLGALPHSSALHDVFAGKGGYQEAGCWCAMQATHAVNIFFPLV